GLLFLFVLLVVSFSSPRDADPIYAKTTDVNHKKKVGKRRNKHRISTFFSLKTQKAAQKL
ncbi:hypothetical protein, partial [Prevotella melaninogenica]